MRKIDYPLECAQLCNSFVDRKRLRWLKGEHLTLDPFDVMFAGMDKTGIRKSNCFMTAEMSNIMSEVLGEEDD